MERSIVHPLGFVLGFVRDCDWQQREEKMTHLQVDTEM